MVVLVRKNRGHGFDERTRAKKRILLSYVYRAPWDCPWSRLATDTDEKVQRQCVTLSLMRWRCDSLSARERKPRQRDGERGNIVQRSTYVINDRRTRAASKTPRGGAFAPVNSPKYDAPCSAKINLLSS